MGMGGIYGVWLEGGGCGNLWVWLVGVDVRRYTRRSFFLANERVYLIYKIKLTRKQSIAGL